MGLSYDSPAVLKQFSKRAGITFTLLGDADSSSLKKLGLVNPEAKGMAEGVAFPGVIHLDGKGTIQETFFEDSYAVRPASGSLLARLFPDLKSKAVTTRAEDYQLSATGEGGIAGSTWEFLVTFPLPAKAHLYAPGTKNYQPLELKLDPNPWLDFGAPLYPKSQELNLEVIGESVPVFSNRVELVIPVRVKRNDGTKALKKATQTTVTGTLKYQICDDEKCYLPQTKPVKWKAEIRPLDRQRAKAK